MPQRHVFNLIVCVCVRQHLVESMNSTSPSLLSLELLRIVNVLVQHAAHSGSEAVIRVTAFALWDFAQDDGRTAGGWSSTLPYDPTAEDAVLCSPAGGTSGSESTAAAQVKDEM